MAGAHFNETVASKPPVDLRLPTAALEQADRKSLRPESLLCRNSSRSKAGVHTTWRGKLLVCHRSAEISPDLAHYEVWRVIIGPHFF